MLVHRQYKSRYSTCVLFFFTDFFFQFMCLEQLFLLFSFLFVIVFFNVKILVTYITASKVHHKLIHDISLTSVISNKQADSGSVSTMSKCDH